MGNGIGRVFLLEMVITRYDETMKPQPARVRGNTTWEKLDHAVRTIFTVSKEALLKEEARLKKAREKKR
jgi:hypothetical protein